MRRPECELDTVFMIGREWDRIRRHTPLESIEFNDGPLDATGVYADRPVTIEIERYSSAFFAHGHDPTECDVVICYAHDRDQARQRRRVEDLRREHGDADPRYRRAKNALDQQENSFMQAGIVVIALKDILPLPPRRRQDKS